MQKRSRGAIALLCLLVAGAITVALVLRGPWSGDRPSVGSPVAKPEITLEKVKPVKAGDPVRLTGVLKSDVSPKDATVVLQRKQADRWVAVEKSRVQEDGSYGFLQIFRKPTKRVFRAVASHGDKTLDESAEQTVAVAERQVSGTAMLPDLGIKKLTDCAKSEQPCFKIKRSGERRLLKFPAVTVNIGEGALEVRAYRATPKSTEWRATQMVHYPKGQMKSKNIAGDPVFYYAEDGHDHWHIKDFDSYAILDKTGKKLKIGEKHGFCFEDNTRFRDWAQNPPADHPNVPRRPFYEHETSCGEADFFASDIVHGLSVGWADTYPSSLPDQFIDVTKLPDGVYTIRVTSDGKGLVEESNEKNNAATVQVKIKKDKVSVVEGSATGL